MTDYSKSFQLGYDAEFLLYKAISRLEVREKIVEARFNRLEDLVQERGSYESDLPYDARLVELRHRADQQLDELRWRREFYQEARDKIEQAQVIHVDAKTRARVNRQDRTKALN